MSLFFRASERNTDVVFTNRRTACFYLRGLKLQRQLPLSLSEEVSLALPLSAAAAAACLWRDAFNNMFNFQQHQRVYPQTTAPLQQTHYKRDFSWICHCL